MGNINFKNFVKRMRMTDNGYWDDGCSGDYVTTLHVYKDGYLNPSLYPCTDFLLFPTALASTVAGFWSNDYDGSGSSTVSVGNNKVVNGFAISTRRQITDCGDTFSENNHIFPLKYLNYSDTGSRVFNQKVYPTNFFTFTNSEDYVGLSASTITLDLSNFNYNDGEDWTTQTKVYVMKITKTGVNGTGEFVLRHFPYIINNNEYETLPAGNTSVYSESVHVYKDTTNITFMNTKGGLKDDFTTVDGLWAESRRKDPTVYDDFVCLVLEDANTLNVYDFHSPFLPTLEKTIVLADDTYSATWANGSIYTLGDFTGVNKIDYTTEAVTNINVPYIEYPSSKYFYISRTRPWNIDYFSAFVNFNGVSVMNSNVCNRSYLLIVDKNNNILQSTMDDTEIISLLQDIYDDVYTDDYWLFGMFYEGNSSIVDKATLLGIEYYTGTKNDTMAIGKGTTILYNNALYVTPDTTKIDSYSLNLTNLVAHPDQDYVYLILPDKQYVIDLSDNSIITTTHDFSGYADLMPVFDEDGNVWIGKYKLDKEDLSLLYTHTTEAFCNYNFIVDDNDEYFDLDGVSLDNGNYSSGAYSSTISITINEGTTVTYDTGVSLEEGKHNLIWEADSGAGGGGSTSVHMYAIFENNTTGEMFKYEDYSYFGSWSTRGIDACFLSKGVYTIKFQNAGSYWEKIRNLSVNSTPIDTDFLAFTTLDNVIKRHPQTWLFPYNTTDITQMYNQYTWFDSTGSEYDGSTNAYEIPLNGEVTIADGIKIIVDDNEGYNQVVKDDYFYFVVSGKGLVLDNWSSANISIALNAWDYTEYTKSIVLSDAIYTIEEAGLDNFIELNTLVISGTWNDSSKITFTTSTPSEGEIQLNSNGTMTFNTNDMGRTATITYNVGFGE